MKHSTLLFKSDPNFEHRITIVNQMYPKSFWCLISCNNNLYWKIHHVLQCLVSIHAVKLKSSAVMVTSPLRISSFATWFVLSSTLCTIPKILLDTHIILGFSMFLGRIFLVILQQCLFGKEQGMCLDFVLPIFFRLPYRLFSPFSPNATQWNTS